MIKEIVTDLQVLSQKSSIATRHAAHNDVLIDLLDTAKANVDNCVGLAAIQIGQPVRIIAVRHNKVFYPMINARVVDQSRATDTIEEGCLSIPGTRAITRPVWITVLYQERLGGKFVKRSYQGMQARIIQHELDHCDGKLV